MYFFFRSDLRKFCQEILEPVRMLQQLLQTFQLLNINMIVSSLISSIKRSEVSGSVLRPAAPAGFTTWLWFNAKTTEYSLLSSPRIRRLKEFIPAANLWWPIYLHLRGEITRHNGETRSSVGTSRDRERERTLLLLGIWCRTASPLLHLMDFDLCEKTQISRKPHTV